MKSRILLFLCMIFVFESCSKANDFERYKTDFTADFTASLELNKVHNAVYSVFTTDSIILRDAYSKDGKFAPDSVFLIGSVTKVFTAVAIMQLVEAGKLNLDSAVDHFVPEFNIKQRFEVSEPITIRDVLTHHAGLPSDIYLRKFSKENVQLSEIMDYLNAQYTTSPNRKIWSYSNLGYALLGYLIEKVSGVSYQNYIESHIFEKLKMNKSGFYTSYQDQFKIALSCDYSGKTVTEMPLIDKPAGAIYSNMQDMIKFCRAFIDRKELLLKNSTLEQMFQLQNKDNLLDLDRRSALCFNLKNKSFELGPVLEHGGATLYQRAQIYIVPEAKLAAVILSDSPKGIEEAWKLNEEVMVEYCRTFDKLPMNPKNQSKNSLFTSIQSKKLDEFVGTYVMPGMSCSIRMKDGHLKPEINGEDFYLIPEDSNSFVPAIRKLGVFWKNKKMHFLLEEINGEKLFIQAMPWGELQIIGVQTKIKTIPKIWKDRIGCYKVMNGKDNIQFIDSIQIDIKNGFVSLNYKTNKEIPESQVARMSLELKNDTLAFVLGLGRGGGESVLFSPDNQSFKYMGLTFKSCTYPGFSGN